MTAQRYAQAVYELQRKLGNSIVETVRGLGYRLGPAQAPEQRSERSAS